MVSKKVVILSAVGVLGGLAFIFGVAGYFTGVKDSGQSFQTATDYSFCKWQASPATGLGIVGCFFMLGAQIISNVGGGCVCCCIKQTLYAGSKTTAILSLVISWVLTTLASIFLFLGGVYNSGAVHYQLDVSLDGTTLSCYYPPVWHLIVGGVLSLFATLLAICFYILANPNNTSTDFGMGASGNVGIQMPIGNYSQSGAAVGVGGYKPGVPTPGYY